MLPSATESTNSRELLTTQLQELLFCWRYVWAGIIVLVTVAYFCGHMYQKITGATSASIVLGFASNLATGVLFWAANNNPMERATAFFCLQSKCAHGPEPSHAKSYVAEAANQLERIEVHLVCWILQKSHHWRNKGIQSSIINLSQRPNTKRLPTAPSTSLATQAGVYRCGPGGAQNCCLP